VTDDLLERIVGNLLRAGVLAAASVVLAGGAWYLASAGNTAPEYHTFQPTVRGLHSVAALPGPQELIMIGLLILVATPVARVIFSLVAFVLEGDRVYMSITVIVLLILLYSLGTAWLR
jgi:uncharacterized membrane protein